MDDIALLVSIAEAAMFEEMDFAEELNRGLLDADRVIRVKEYFIGVE